MMKMCEMVDIMFRNHQELCPHDMEWVIETTNPKSNTKETKYRCKVCGKEEVVVDEH